MKKIAPFLYRRLPASFLALWLSVTAIAASAPAPATGKVFRAGAATSNITPPLGVEIVGSWTVPRAKHIHDELHARCLALDDGTTRLVFVVVDNVGVPREIFDAAKRMAHEATGLPVGNMLMSATHTHSAPSARGANALVSGQPLDDYQNFLIRRIADGVQRAINNLEPARVGWGAGSLPQHLFNRRWLPGDNSTTLNPFGEQDRLSYGPTRSRPAGPTDPDVYFISVQSTKGRPIALLANYGLHYVAGFGNFDISANYFGAFCDRIRRLFEADDQDPPFVGILANGAAGDVINESRVAPEPANKYRPYEKIRFIANEVAQEVMRVHRTIEFRDWAPLRVAHSELTLDMRRPTPAMVSRAEQILARPPNVSPVHGREAEYARRTLAAKNWPPTIDIVMQVFRIGDLGVAAIPFETFAETGLEIKAKSPFKGTFVIELANGATGYLPTPEQHALGGYETWLGTNRVEKEASRKIVARLLELFAQVND